MQPHEKRLFRALAREGLTVSHDGPIYTVRLTAHPGAPPAEILLPDALPLEAKAVRQLAELAATRHPDGGAVCRACATPDFHPGDSGIAIGSVVESSEILIPQAVGTDINCGMRLHVTDLGIDRFLAQKPAFVQKMMGDYLLGTRDVPLTGVAMRAMFEGGIPAFIDAARSTPQGQLTQVDWDQLEVDTARVFGDGSMDGSSAWAPEKLIPDRGWLRDEGLATIGRGNHFVEVQVVDEVVDRAKARAWGVRLGQVAFMTHSGSRNVGQFIGKRWSEKAKEAWPAGVRHPESGIFPISAQASPDLFAEYLRAEATAANYGYVNRLLLAELLRLRLREVYGPSIEAPLVYDLPHNVTLVENGRVVARKGACPAAVDQPVIIPGSMGASSFLCVGKGNERFLRSASHGAGRATARGGMGRTVRDAAHRSALGLDGVECVTLREERRVEEAPAAYKPIGPVIDAQVEAGMVGLVARMRPLLTFKA